MTLSATVLTAQLAELESKAAVPASLHRITLHGAHALAHQLGASVAINPAASLSAYALAEGVLHAMIAHQIKTVALPLLLIAGTVATGVGVAATRLSDGPADGEKGSQVRAASMVPAKSLSNGPAAQAPLRKTESGTSSISPLLVENLGAEMSTFSRLLARFASDLKIEDIHRLYDWSNKTLEADQAIATTDADRVAASAAHRDRMKKLVELTQDIPASDTQHVASDLAQTILERAEAGLKNISENQGASRMMGMMQMMGRGSMGTSREGQTDNMGTGGGRAGMMAAMMGGARIGAERAQTWAEPGRRERLARPTVESGCGQGSDAVQGDDATGCRRVRRSWSNSGPRHERHGRWHERRHG